MRANEIIRKTVESVAVLCLFSLTAVSAASAQTVAAPNHSLDDALRPGRTAWITDASGNEEKTRILGVAGDVITASAGDRIRHFRTADIMRIEVRHFDSVLNGALIGAGSMIATGLFLCTAMEPWETCAANPGPFMYAGAVGAGIGIGIDALWPSRKTIYDRTRGSLRWHAAPIVSRETKGLQVAITF
jgi:hypothetical protein